MQTSDRDGPACTQEWGHTQQCGMSCCCATWHCACTWSLPHGTPALCPPGRCRGTHALHSTCLGDTSVCICQLSLHICKAIAAKDVSDTMVMVWQQEPLNWEIYLATTRAVHSGANQGCTTESRAVLLCQGSARLPGLWRLVSLCRHGQPNSNTIHVISMQTVLVHALERWQE
jgi:hypothetical protein